MDVIVSSRRVRSELLELTQFARTIAVTCIFSSSLQELDERSQQAQPHQTKTSHDLSSCVVLTLLIAL